MLYYNVWDTEIQNNRQFIEKVGQYIMYLCKAVHETWNINLSLFYVSRLQSCQLHHKLCKMFKCV